jgi:ethanolamine utilization protein EutQ (cupin superfamily)
MTPIRSYTGPTTWQQVDGQDIWMGDVGEEADRHRMSVGFAKLAAGTSAGVPAPYNEVWIVVEGGITLRGAGEPVAAEAGDIVYVPAATSGTVHAETSHGEQDTTLVLVAHPPRWSFQERDWEHVRAEPRAEARSRRYTAAAVPLWLDLDGGPGRLGYSVDNRDEIPFGFGFGHTQGEMAMDFRFPYDEVVVALTGRFTVRSEGAEHVVEQGGLVYLPTGSQGGLHAESGTSLAFVHHPTAKRAEQEWGPAPLMSPELGELPAEEGTWTPA